MLGYDQALLVVGSGPRVLPYGFKSNAREGPMVGPPGRVPNQALERPGPPETVTVAFGGATAPVRRLDPMGRARRGRTSFSSLSDCNGSDRTAPKGSGRIVSC